MKHIADLEVRAVTDFCQEQIVEDREQRKVSRINDNRYVVATLIILFNALFHILDIIVVALKMLVEQGEKHA